MRTFKDNAGRTWTLSVNVAAIQRVRDLANVDLLSIADGKLVDQLMADPVLLCNALFALVKPEADKHGVTDQQFGEAMAGDAIEHATTALLEDLVDFFPSAKRRVLTKAIKAMRALQEQVLVIAEEQLAEPVLATYREAVLKRLGGLSGNSPESSASTRDA